MWAVGFLFLVMYMFAVYFETVCWYYLMDRSLAEEHVSKEIAENWQGMGSAMRSLTYSVTGGDWKELSSPFWSMGWTHGLMFMVYILFINCGMLNIMVGVFA